MLSYEEHADIWKQISKEGLLFPRMPNNIIIDTPCINPFWKRLEKNINVFLNNLCTKGWDTTIMMDIEVDDDKVHLNHKIAIDNARRVRHAKIIK